MAEWSRETLMALSQDDIIYVEVSSTWIEAVSYDLKTSTVVVSSQHNRDDYTYYDRPFEDYLAFVNADSPGSFFNMYVRGRW